jgi:hypothetical protein
MLGFEIVQLISNGLQKLQLEKKIIPQTTTIAGAKNRQIPRLVATMKLMRQKTRPA